MTASIFSSLLSRQVSAEAGALNSVNEAYLNSQNMTLLTVDASSSLAVLNNKKNKDSKNKEEVIDETKEVNIVSENALLSTGNPISAEDESIRAVGGSFSSDISVYVVRKGDSISQIAEMFDVSVNTILSVNEMKKGDKLKEGDVLLILPFSGVEHTVAKGQTLRGIANLYKVDLDDILLSNDIDVDAKLSVGEKLIIPGVDLPSEIGTKKSSNGSTAKKSSYSDSSAKSIGGYFIHPVPSARRTRGTNSTHRGVDFGASSGTPIYASADGRVTFARTGKNGGFGTMVILSHSNGTETLYAHMSKLGTTTGSQVSQGEVIGYVGSTGRSTGPHLHFEVHGAKNPF